MEPRDAHVQGGDGTADTEQEDTQQQGAEIDAWEKLHKRKIPNLLRTTLEHMSAVIAGFQSFSEWEQEIPVILDVDSITKDDLFVKDDIVSATLRCHAGNLSSKVISFRNIIFQIQLAAKVHEYVSLCLSLQSRC